MSSPDQGPEVLNYGDVAAEYGNDAAQLPPRVTLSSGGETSEEVTQPSALGKQQESVVSWQYERIAQNFGSVGCSKPGCEHNNKPNEDRCALNLSDAIIQAGYELPPVTKKAKCAHGRILTAGRMHSVVKQVCGKAGAVGWKDGNNPKWRGIVYFYKSSWIGTSTTGHIDLWDGANVVHTPFPEAETVLFYRLA